MVQIVKMCNAFSSLGNEVELTTTNRESGVSQSPEEYYGEELNFTCRRVNVIDGVKLSQGKPQFIKHFLFFIQRFQFAQRVRTIGADVIYARDPLLLWILSFKLSKDVQLIYESHEAHYNFFVRRLFSKGVKVVVISEGIRDFYIDKGESETQMLVAHDGIDETFFEDRISQTEARHNLGLSSEKKVAMYIGGFDAWKGVETFFAASELNTEVLFVAIGGKQDEIDSYSKKYPKVKFLGPRSYHELRFHQQAADVLVVPSTAKNKLASHYTSPLKLFAHMASGVPLLVSDVPSMRAVVDEESATFFAADDSQALSEGLNSIIRDFVSARERSSMTLKLAHGYTWDERAKKIVSFLD